MLNLVVNDSRAKLAAIGAKINVKLQELSDETPCPAPQFFREAKRIVQEVLDDDLKSDFTTEDAMNILDELDNKLTNRCTLPVFSQELEHRLGIERVNVPDIEGQNYENSVIDWLEKLEEHRQDLLEINVLLRLRLGKDTDSDIVLPHQEIIEHQFIEEMASLRKCLEVSDRKREHVVRLMKLLSRRINWMQNAYTEIMNGKLSLLLVLLSERRKYSTLF